MPLSINSPTARWPARSGSSVKPSGASAAGRQTTTSAKARKLIQEDCRRERQEYAAEHIATLHEILEAMMKQELRLCFGASQQLAKLAKLTGSSRIRLDSINPGGSMAKRKARQKRNAQLRYDNQLSILQSGDEQLDQLSVLDLAGAPTPKARFANGAALLLPTTRKGSAWRLPASTDLGQP